MDSRRSTPPPAAAPPETRPTLFIAHAQELLLAGLVAIASDHDLRVSGVAATADVAVARIRELDPGVAIIDGALPRAGGFAVAREVAKAAPRVRVILSVADVDDTHRARARAAGAMNCLGQGASAREVVAAVALAAKGRLPAPPDPFAIVADKLGARDGRGADAHLTPRERQVLRHLAFALDNDEIAAALSIGVETVKTHVHKLLQKMSLRDRTQAAVWAVRNGVV